MPSRTTSRLRKRHVALGLALAATLALGVWEAPPALRTLDGFRVRRVEVMGTRFLPPHVVVAAAGLAQGASVFDPSGVWEERVERLHLVRSARAHRRLPATVVIEVEERRPVALVRTPELRPVDRHGQILPIRTAGRRIDLPVVDGVTGLTAAGRVADTRVRALVAFAGRTAELEPSLADRLSEVGLRDGVLRLALRDPAGASVILPPRPEALHLAELRIALADLAARGELERVRHIDLRYRDQAIVAFTRAL